MSVVDSSACVYEFDQVVSDLAISESDARKTLNCEKYDDFSGKVCKYLWFAVYSLLE